MTARLEIQNIKKNLGGAQVLAGADLSVGRGEIVAVYSRSGGGKSVLLDIISGALPADDGEITIDGRPMSAEPPENRNIGMAFQSFALYPHMTAFDNIASPLRRGKDAGGIRGKVEEVARLLKIDAFLSHHPHALSNGQKQRTALARALVAVPAVLLLDDPLRNVDAKLRYEMRLEMPELFRRFESAVIYVTQDYREAMALADRIAVLHEGKFAQVGTPEDIYEFPCNTEVGKLMGEPTMNLFPCATSMKNGALSIHPANCAVDISKFYDMPAGEYFFAGVRPENVNISSSDGGEYSVKAVVESVTPANIRAQLELKTANGERITITRPEKEAKEMASGDVLYLSFPADKILLFSRNDGGLVGRRKFNHRKNGGS